MDWVKEQEMIPVSSVGKAMASGEDVEDALEQKKSEAALVNNSK